MAEIEASTSAMVSSPSEDRSIDRIITELAEAARGWAGTTPLERFTLLRAVRSSLVETAAEWVAAALYAKRLGTAGLFAAEEWLAGPTALLLNIDGLIDTLENLDGPFRPPPLRVLTDGRLAVQVFPRTAVDRILAGGVTARVIMQPGITRESLASTMAASYRLPPPERMKGVALILGAGNVTSIGPLDAIDRLFAHDQVALLKLNPVLDTMRPVLERAMAPLIERNLMAIISANAKVSSTLVNHPLVTHLHITGSGASHDTIVFGVGEAGADAKQAGVPINPRPITSELGGVSPTIILPGCWSGAELQFQAEQVATQKLNNGGANCIATQVLVLPAEWGQAGQFEERLQAVFVTAGLERPPYAGGDARLSAFGDGRLVGPITIVDVEPGAPDVHSLNNEVFGPGLAIVRLSGTDPATFLKAAVDFANTELPGTLGANVVIDPRTRRQLGSLFDEEILRLKYGTVAINAWTALGYSFASVPWGAHPGHTLADVGSGIGFVHNTMMFGAAERTLIEAPFRASLRPPWFSTSRSGSATAQRLFAYYANPKPARLLGVVIAALLS